jgi:60 kDa SS-A/Ro ribonucleoprotein
MPNPYAEYLSTPIPQSEKADPRQVANSAGGFTFVVDDQARLERFLILGTEGGTYYIGERDLTKRNTDFIVELISKNEELVYQVTRDISTSGRAYRNSPAIFVTALMLKHATDKARARSLVADVCRISTHLFELATYIEHLGGWPRTRRVAVAEWYTSKTPDALAYQAVKYRQREGWTHRDLFRLSHPKGVDHNVGAFILDKPEIRGEFPPIIHGFRLAQDAKNVPSLLSALEGSPNLPWEAIPTQFLREPDVWRKLFYNGQLNGQALVRNITRLARINAFDDMVFARDYASKLTDEQMMKRTRIHPIQYLLAAVVHERGQKDKTGYSAYKKDWPTVPVIVDALNAGFRLAFKYAEPSNKRTMVALDVSGSMSSDAAGVDLSCAELGAAMSIIVARTEPYYSIYGFSDGTTRSGYTNWGMYNQSKLTDLGITPSMDLATVTRKTAEMNFGRTDCALPMLFAQERKLEVDTFFIFTDNETWYGSIHPYKALQNYRQSSGIDAKLIVAAAVASEFTIADPTDRGMLDVVGADSNLPKLVTEFSAGRI